MGYKRWKPSKTQAREFSQKMRKIDNFCYENGISQSTRGDSYYFVVNGQHYRVSNHSVESSPYHTGRSEDITYIHASKTRIMDIYTDLKNGYKLDGRGCRVKEV